MTRTNEAPPSHAAREREERGDDLRYIPKSAARPEPGSARVVHKKPTAVTAAEPEATHGLHHNHTPNEPALHAPTAAKAPRRAAAVKTTADAGAPEAAAVAPGGAAAAAPPPPSGSRVVLPRDAARQAAAAAKATTESDDDEDDRPRPKSSALGKPVPAPGPAKPPAAAPADGAGAAKPKAKKKAAGAGAKSAKAAAASGAAAKLARKAEPEAPSSERSGRMSGSQALFFGAAFVGATALCAGVTFLVRRTLRRNGASRPAAAAATAASPILPARRAALLKGQEARDFGAVLERCHVEGAPNPAPPAAPRALAGLTFGVKDNIDVEGQLTGNGNPLWRSEQRPAPSHAPAVAALLAAGATATHRLHMDELAYSLQGANPHHGTPCNPAAPERIPGGSSSGSAVAVAAGLCDFALGTDTAGSVRVPAACCGIYGFRSTHGAVSTQGVCPLAPSLDTVGWFARDPQTLARVGKALLPPGPAPPASPQPGRVLIAVDLFLRCETAQMQLSITALEASLKALYGADRVLAVSLAKYIVTTLAPSLEAFVPHRDAEGRADPLVALMEASKTLQQHEVWTCLGPWFERTGGRGVGQAVGSRLEAAKSVTAERMAEAAALRAAYRDVMSDSLGGQGGGPGGAAAPVLLVIPTLPAPPLDLEASAEECQEWRTRTMELTAVAGFGGLPQATLPIGTTDDEDACPMSISLVGPPGSDAWLLEHVGAVGAAVTSAYKEVQRVYRETPDEEDGQPGQAQASQASQPGRSSGGPGGAAPAGASAAAAGCGKSNSNSNANSNANAKRPAAPAAPAKPLSREEQAQAEAERAATEMKNTGNDHFKAGRYREAALSYTAALGMTPGNSVLFSNRAMARIKMLDYKGAEQDCDAALRGDPRNVKALLRRGSARSGQGNFEGARQDYDFVLHLEPDNRQAREERANVMGMLRSLGER